MGCDIFSWVEVYAPAGRNWKAIFNAFPADAFQREHDHIEFVSYPFRWRDYGLFGFLAGVRNYAHCEPLAAPSGLPPGCDVEGGCRVDDIDSLGEFHSHSWFLVSELQAFDYTGDFGTDEFRGARTVPLSRTKVRVCIRAIGNSWDQPTWIHSNV